MADAGATAVGTPAEAANISVSNIRGFGGSDIGPFRMSNELLGWKNKKTNTVYQYKSSELNTGEWIRTGNNSYRLIVKLKEPKDTDIIFFDGIPDRHVKEITDHFQKHFNITLPTKKITSRGWNWGQFNLDKSGLIFDIDKKYAFTVDTNTINQLNVQIKTDMAMEFKTDEDKFDDNDDFLSEIRFYYPHETEEDQTFQNLKTDMLERVNIGDSAMESIASLTDIFLLVPRGKYDIELYKKSFKLHGKSYDFNVQYTNISKMLLVPKNNSNQYVLVMGLINKMKQGQTEYPFIVFQLVDDTEDIEVSMNANEEVLSEYKLEKTISGKPYDVVTKLFTALVKKNVILSGDFRTAKGQHGITCTYKTASGHLYPLNKYFLFIIKPVILIAFEDVDTVTFQRTGNISQQRFFSIIIKNKRGTNYEYTNIDKNEYDVIMQFMKSKNINVEDDSGNNATLEVDLDESDEEDYVAEEDDDDEEDYAAEDEEEGDEDDEEDDEEDDDEDDEDLAEEDEDE